MTKTYAQIVKQIEVLKQDAEKVRRKEVAGVVSRIQEAIAVYGLTADDLGFGSKKAKSAQSPAVRRRNVKSSQAAQAPGVVKFRNDSGGTWGGRGKRPDWLRKALAEGKSLEEFAVK
jgi:DNA-binding protein H-NS